ncbi:MAG: RnfABCDGE type electron transport complex subunit B [Lentisphaerae bacterium]|nr:RnfABCDGE type electron transport complex subunit B [Lentisphaerota bacterium]
MDPVIQHTILIGMAGLVCGALLALVSHYFAVHEDPTVEALTAALPGINCGGCGYAGCAAYAKAVATENIGLDLCKPGGAETVAKMAAITGRTASAREREVAVVLCNGSRERARQAALYNGVADCAAADLVAGGGKSCRFGCLGFGSCARVCPTGAIEIADSLAVVHPELCIGCGKCTGACPRKLIKLVPESRSIHVLCINRDRGPDVKKVCDVGCIGCTLCSKACNNEGIKMDGFLAVVDYTVPLNSPEIATKCPTKAIAVRPGVKKEAAA